MEPGISGATAFSDDSGSGAVAEFVPAVFDRVENGLRREKKPRRAEFVAASVATADGAWEVFVGDGVVPAPKACGGLTTTSVCTRVTSTSLGRATDGSTSRVVFVVVRAVERGVSTWVERIGAGETADAGAEEVGVRAIATVVLVRGLDDESLGWWRTGGCGEVASKRGGKLPDG